MKKCSYCWEQIQDIAKKCRFCWEWLEEKETHELKKTNEKQISHEERQLQGESSHARIGKETQDKYIYKFSKWVAFVPLIMTITSVQKELCSLTFS